MGLGIVLLLLLSHDTLAAELLAQLHNLGLGLRNLQLWHVSVSRPAAPGTHRPSGVWRTPPSNEPQRTPTDPLTCRRKVGSLTVVQGLHHERLGACQLKLLELQQEGRVRAIAAGASAGRVVRMHSDGVSVSNARARTDPRACAYMASVPLSAAATAVRS